MHHAIPNAVVHLIDQILKRYRCHMAYQQALMPNYVQLVTQTSRHLPIGIVGQKANLAEFASQSGVWNSICRFLSSFDFAFSFDPHPSEIRKWPQVARPWHLLLRKQLWYLWTRGRLLKMCKNNILNKPSSCFRLLRADASASGRFSSRTHLNFACNRCSYKLHL